MRYIILPIILSLVLAGCLTPQEMPFVPEQPEEQCRMVTEEVQVIEEQCGDVSYTEQVCELKKLEYTITEANPTHLCISEGVCNGQPLGDCQGCSRAMTRCVMQIKNDEAQKSGSWTVAANYTLDSAGFVKDPKTATIGPGEVFSFDFYQIYNPGSPINSASCLLYVTSEPKTEDCYEETITRQECKDVETTKTLEKEVCE